jgi:hypothetical protein
MLVIGHVGEGKSSLVKTLLWRSSVFGHSAVVADPEGKYGPLAAAYGIRPVRIGPGLPARLNPLDPGPSASVIPAEELSRRLLATLLAASFDRPPGRYRCPRRRGPAARRPGRLRRPRPERRVLVWSAGQIAGRLAIGAWPRVAPTAGLDVLARLPRHLSDPAAAWPTDAHGSLPGPVPIYAALAVELLLAGFLVAAVWQRVVLWRAGARHRARDRSFRWGRRDQLRPLLVDGPERGRLLLGWLGRRRLVAAEQWATRPQPDLPPANPARRVQKKSCRCLRTACGPTIMEVLRSRDWHAPRLASLVS